MTLAGARVALNAQESDYLDINIREGRVSQLSRPASRVETCSNEGFNLNGFLVLPGLINAHDHLEFSLFPRLGRGTYPNATAWSKDIYRPNEFPIRQHLDIPKQMRLLWGGIKNLVNGVTSVSHHNPYDAEVFDWGFPVRVVKHFGWAHSLDFCPDPSEKFLRTPSCEPFLIHAGEGTDEQARSEIKRLDDAGILAANTVIVHGVAVGPDDLIALNHWGVSLVWCPSSNLFTLGKTLSEQVLGSGVPIALGTDSALTAEGDLVSEIRTARRYVSMARIYEMLTGQAAAILRLHCGEGTVREGAFGDLLVVRDQGQTPANALLDLHPELVLIGGRVKLISLRLADQLKPRNARDLHRIEVEGRGEWLIDCDVAALEAPAKWVLGENFRLARNRVAS